MSMCISGSSTYLIAWTEGLLHVMEAVCHWVNGINNKPHFSVLCILLPKWLSLCKRQKKALKLKKLPHIQHIVFISWHYSYQPSLVSSLWLLPRVLSWFVFILWLAALYSCPFHWNTLDTTIMPSFVFGCRSEIGKCEGVNTPPSEVVSVVIRS